MPFLDAFNQGICQAILKRNIHLTVHTQMLMWASKDLEGIFLIGNPILPVMQ